MSSAVAELDTYLQSMLQMKPPGVSGSKISSITSLCNNNVQSESALITKIYTHFKKTPGTHKLGVLYVVDSVTRQWVEQARKAGQTIAPGAPDGTYAAGVNRVTELLPVLMADIINTAPEDQKARIKKLVDIWERGSTFPGPILSNIKDKLNAPTVPSTTPPGSPGRDLLNSINGINGQQPASAAQAAPNTTAILAALANMAKQNTSTPPNATAAGASGQNSLNVTNPQNAVPQNVSSSVDQARLHQSNPTPQAVNPLGGVNLASQFPGLAAMTQNQNSSLALPAGQSNPLAALMPQANAGAPSLPQETLQQLQVIQVLAAQGIPQEQWPTILALVGSQTTANNTTNGIPNPTATGWPSQPGNAVASAWDGRNDYASRDRQNRDPFTRSPPGAHYRARSRSPGAWDRHRDTSPPRRGSPVYGEYDGKSPTRNGNRGGDDPYDRQGRNRGRGGRDGYRQRSPPGGRRRRSPTPPQRDQTLPPPGPKHVEFDPSIPQGNIKVLSRTLFVGGVTSGEEHLRSIFSNFGVVQTCIVNIDKRHAFVKMISRADAMRAREGMEHYKSDTMQLRTRWGVGFGPRDCSDYNTGISIIPIERLTEADRKWMLTAEYGGSGGRPIESGFVVEEPDIEIGAGVSSKAISRRMATDSGGKTGPRSTRPANEPAPAAPAGRYRRPERDGPGNDRAADNNAIGVPPAVPGFGFQFPTMPGMPMFTQGFLMPQGQQGQQGTQGQGHS
ncbi:MAG: hypothetical protein M1834_001843 [Cirrosporium novae-zelandiae]|nr:MAG: hypothetical protein M1834_001843 [Cirrosporium novae-zelandiae]